MILSLLALLALPPTLSAWSLPPLAASRSADAHRARAPVALVDGVAHSGTAAFAAAFGASVIATVAMHPMDTLKVRQQAESETTCGMWRGVSANVLKEAPDAAVFLAISETLSQSLAYSSPWFASHLTMTLLLAGAVGEYVAPARAHTPPLFFMITAPC